MKGAPAAAFLRRAAIGAVFAAIGIAGATPATAQTPPPPPGGTAPTPSLPPPPAPPSATTAPAPYPPQYMYPPPIGAPILATSRPDELPYSEGRLVEDGYHVEKKYRMGLVAGGGAVFLGLYGITAAYAGVQVSKGDDKAAPALVPIFGPIIVAAGFDYKCDFCGLLIIPAFFLVLDSLGQAGGLAMFIAGMAKPKLVQVKNNYAETSAFPALRLRPDGLSLVF